MLKIVRKDMFSIQTDAIINAANKELRSGGGVDGLMSKHCGPKLQEAKDEIAKNLPNNQLGPGEAVSTAAFAHLLADFVVHVAAPQVQAHHKPTRTQECELRLCYYNSLLQAADLMCKSVTFPILGIGLYHWPERMGTAIAIQSICGFFEANPNTNIETVYLTMMSDSVLQTCLSHTNQVCELDCSTVHLSRTARELIERSASNVKTALCSSLDVASFVEQWASSSERKGRKIKSMISGRESQTSCSSGEVPATTSRGFVKTVKGWFTKKTVQNQKKSQPQKTPQPRTPRTPEEQQQFRNYFSNDDSQRTPSRKRRSNQKKEKELKEEQEKIEQMFNSELAICSLLKCAIKKERTKDAAELVKNGDVDALMESLDENIAVSVKSCFTKHESSSQDSTLFFRTLLSVLRVIHLLKTVDATIENLKENIHSILKEKVLCPKGCSEVASEARTLLRMNYHVWDDSQPYDGFSKMNELYPELWAEFVGKAVVKDRKRHTGIKVTQSKNLASWTAEREVQTDSENLPEGEVDQMVLFEDKQEEENVSDYEDDADESLNLVAEAAIAEIYPEIELNMEALGILKRTMHIKRCDLTCVQPDVMLSAAVYKRLLEFSQSSLEDRESLSRLKSDGVVGNFVWSYLACFAGLRSMQKRLTTLDDLYSVAMKIEQGLQNGNLELLEEVLSLRDLPSFVRINFCRTFNVPTDQSHHYEGETRKKYGHLLGAFEKAMETRETSVCDLCNQISANKDMFKRETKDLWSLLSKRQQEIFKTEELLDVCRMCTREMPHGKLKLPAAAEANGLLVEETPKELQGFNFLEKALIQLRRPIQAIMHLRDKGGRMTGVKATTGAMVVVPVPLEKTHDHVANTLPSDSNLFLHIKTRFGASKIARLPVVLKALAWLKENSPFYKEVRINEQFNIDDDRVHYDKNVLHKDNKALMSKDDEYLLTQEDTEIQPVRDVQPPPIEGFAVDNYLLKSHPYKPLSNDEKDIEPQAFPHLFPTGRFHFGYKRKVQIQLSKYTRSKIRNVDNKFRTDAAWMCFMYGKRMQTDLLNSMGTQARISRNVSKTDLLGFLGDEKNSSSLNAVFANIKGSSPYWNQRRMELQSHIEEFGNPTWFVTLNPAEKNWPDIVQIYEQFFPGASEENICEFIAQDSFHWCRFFKRRMEAFFSKILMEKDGPLGTLIHHFWRLEYQQRGTQHVHCLFWALEKPKEDASPQEVADYLDKHVTTRMPDEENEPELFEIISKHQMHWPKHSKTCLRVKKRRGQKTQTCRFGFPRPVMAKTTVLGFSDDLLRLPGVPQKQYYLARKKEDIMVNDYNACISLAWKANTDVQYIMAGANDVVNYITVYATKSEKSKGVSLLDMSADDLDNEKMFKTMLDLLRQKETGMLEMMDVLMSHELYGFDTGHVFLNTNEDAKRNRQLRSAKEVEKGGDGPAYVDNFIDTYYPKRPKELEKFALFTVVMNFEVVGKDEAVKRGARFLGRGEFEELMAQPAALTGEQSQFYWHKSVGDIRSPWFCFPALEAGCCLPLEYAQGSTKVTKYFRKRKTQVLRTFLPDVEGDTKSAKDYFRRLCMMFVPWREEMPANVTAEEALDTWNSHMDEIEQMSQQAAEDIHTFLDAVQKIKTDGRNRKEKMQAWKKAMREENANDDDEETSTSGPATRVPEREVDPELFEKNLASMNKQQKEIFATVMEDIHAQTASYYQEKPKKPILKFVSGTAGTGKSFLINMLADQLTMSYTSPRTAATKPAVLLAAPTGLAALNIRGSTIHSLFRIEAQHGRMLDFKGCDFEDTGSSRELLRNIKLIIIDEISMCSNMILTKLHLRLQQIKGNREIFGGVNILAFGDLLQLPPVMSRPVYEPLKPAVIAEVFGSIAPPINLWSLFDYSELTANMRQKNDERFGEVMSRLRIDKLDAEDCNLLKTRLIKMIEKNEDAPCSMEEAAEYYLRVLERDPTTIALFSTNDEVSLFNTTVLKQLGMKTFTILAEDIEKNSAMDEILDGQTEKDRVRKSRIYQKKEFSIVKKTKKAAQAKPLLKEEDPTGRLCGGLAAKLTLAENARVMLRRNVDVGKGLANGSQGYLRSVHKRDGEVVSLGVVFDGFDVETKIERVNAVFNVSRDERRRRSQFPLTVAYAATVHKSQGMTVNHAVISTRSIFSPGQFFVALSRVRSLAGLHLVDFFPNKVSCHRESLLETNRLRQTIGLPAFDVPCKPSKASRDKHQKKNVAIEDDDSDEKTSPIAKKKLRISTTKALSLPNNTSQDCFVNAVVNLMNSSEQLTEDIIKSSAEEEAEIERNMMDVDPTMVQCLANLFLKKDTNVALLRTKLAEERRVGTGDVKEAFDDIFEQLPEAIQKQFRFQCEARQACSQCGASRRLPYSRVLEQIEIRTQNDTIEEALKKWLEDTGRRCNCNAAQNVQVKIDMLQESRYLIVKLNGAGPNVAPELKKDKIAEGFNFFGHRFRLRAAVQFIPGGAGHYVCWRRLDEAGYLLLNDSVLSNVGRLPNHCRNCTLMLMEIIKPRNRPSTATVLPNDMQVVEIDD